MPTVDSRRHDPAPGGSDVRSAMLATPASLLAAVLLLLAGSASPASAQEAGGGDELWSLYDSVRVEGLDSRKFDHGEYWSAVLPVLEGTADLSAKPVGESAEGRTIRSVRFGSGETSVLLWSQMHGDESTATMALADIFRLFAAHPDHPVVRTIAEGTTLHFVPMLNPDGAERFQRRNAQGVDINRDARRQATPEGRLLARMQERLEPDFGFNLHDQNARTRVEDTGRGVAIALLAPAFNEAGDVNEVRGRAMRLAGVIRRSVEPFVGGHVARYDAGFNPRAFGDLMTKWGTSTVLVESGGWRDDPRKQYLRRVNFVGLLRALESIATGSWADVSRAPYEDLPENGRWVEDLLVLDGTLALPGLPPLEAGLLLRYEDPLARTGARVVDIGDMGEAEARDTVHLDGAWIVPDEAMLERRAGSVQIQPGAPAAFTVARDRRGERPGAPRGGRRTAVVVSAAPVRASRPRARDSSGLRPPPPLRAGRRGRWDRRRRHPARLPRHRSSIG